jgi:hypothetical protein
MVDTVYSLVSKKAEPRVRLSFELIKDIKRFNINGYYVRLKFLAIILPYRTILLTAVRFNNRF